jgi:uncharacterized protein YjbI with pentapeptide repeats
MNNDELNLILEQHKLWLDSWGNDGRRARLRGANLRGMDLSGACLRAADMRDADFTDANLQDAEFHWALIMSPSVRKMYQEAAQGSSIFASDESAGGVIGNPAAIYEMQAARARANRDRALMIEESSTKRADLRGAILADANLTNANFTEADLRGADFTGATFDGALLLDARFGKTGWLKSRYTDISKADLHSATDLTQAQVNEAKGDSLTRLPNGLVLRK